jgi:hypothetical protein
LALATATILTSPHIHIQDLQILLLPATLLVAYRRDFFAIAVPSLLFFLIPVAVIGVNLATPALAAALVIVAAKAAGLRIAIGLPRVAWPKGLAGRLSGLRAAGLFTGRRPSLRPSTAAR